MGGKFHPKLSIGSRPIANKYHEGKLRRQANAIGPVGGALPEGVPEAHRRSAGRVFRKGTNGVSTNGVTAILAYFISGFLTERLFGYSRSPAFTFPKVPGRTFFHNLSKTFTFLPHWC